jgi:tetratricopeptide (TPR) repeat protein
MTRKPPHKSVRNPVLPDKSLSTGLLIALLIAAGILVYIPTLKNDFVFDDRALVSNNPLLKGAGGITEVLTSGRTFRMITFVIDHALYGMNPSGFHATNILLHILTGILAFLVLRRISGQPIVGFVAALLFLCHPLTTEAVASVANRKESLHSLFSLLAILTYLEADKKHWLYVIAFIAFIMALTSKEVAIALPVLLIIIDWLFRERNLWAILKRRGWFYGVLVVPIIIGAVYRLRTVKLMDLLKFEVGGSTPYIKVIATSLAKVPDYFRLAIIPFPLSADYYTQIVGIVINVGTFIGILCVLGLAVGGYLLRQRKPLIALGLWWILITWLPVSNMVPSAYFLAERYFYFPLIGVAVIAAQGWEELRNRSVLSYIVLAALVVLLGGLTINRNQDWRDEHRLWASTLRYQPDNPKAHYYFANALRERGQYQDAILHFRKSVQLKPDFVWAWVNLGNIYTMNRDYDSAIPIYRRILELDPNLAVAHNNLGCAFYNMGNTDSARVHYAKAVEENPNYGEAWNNIGIALNESGHPDSAVYDFYRAIQSSPTWGEPYQRIIQCLIDLHDLKNAKLALDKYLELPYIPDRKAREEQREKVVSMLK